MIQIIVFDAYGTLFDVNSIENRLQLHFGNKSAEISLLWRQKQLEYTWLRSLMNRYEPFSKVTAQSLQFSCQKLNLRLEEEVLNDLMEHYNVLATFPEVRSSLEKLADRYQLGVLSNADYGMLQAAVDFNELNPVLSHVISVDTIEKYKPHPDVYRLVQSRFKVNPEEVLFVSSNTWDVSGAKSCGLNVAWLKRGDGTMDTLGLNPDRELKNLTDLLST